MREIITGKSPRLNAMIRTRQIRLMRNIATVSQLPIRTQFRPPLRTLHAGLKAGAGEIMRQSEYDAAQGQVWIAGKIEANKLKREIKQLIALRDGDTEALLLAEGET